MATESNQTMPAFQGRVRKMNIVSNYISYGLVPDPDDEVEQGLTVSASGRVWFSAYCYGKGNQYKLARTKNFNIGKEAAARILNAAGFIFSGGYETVYATDIGTWATTLTNMEGKDYRFGGSLCCKFDVHGINMSDLIRDTLDMPELFLFDGNCKPE